MRLTMMPALAVMALWGCNERPDGSATTEGTISVQVTASANGVALADDGITNSPSVTISGMTTDDFLVTEFAYSWNGGEFVAIDVSELQRDFQLELDLKEDANTLVLRAVDTTEISEPISFDVTYFRDTEPPTITAPTTETAALIFSEADMVAEVNPTNFVLSGGVGVPVKHDVNYSKYSTTHGEGDSNLPVWRFAVEDNYDTAEGAVLEFRIVRGKGEVLVDWTTGSSSEEADFEVVITSDLSPVIALDSGIYSLEVRAVDAAGNRSDAISQSWEQTILNPLLHVEAASEDDMVSGGATDPTTYILDQNFSDILVQDISVGAIRIGNPNNASVTAEVGSLVDARATYSYQRGFDGISQDVQIPFSPFSACDNRDTVQYTQGYGCLNISYETTLGLTQQITRREDIVNTRFTWEFRDLGGNIVGNGTVVEIPSNTVLIAIAKLEVPMSNIPSLVEERTRPGPAQSDVTMFLQQEFWRCSVPTLEQGFPSCDQWNYALVYDSLFSVFATWEFTADLNSKVGTEEATPFQSAQTGQVLGYSRTLSTTSVNQGATPVAH